MRAPCGTLSSSSMIIQRSRRNILICVSRRPEFFRGRYFFMAQQFSKPFYNSAAWIKTARMIRGQHFHLCQICGATAKEVHHIKFLTPDNISNPDITLNPANLVLVCYDCHNYIHQRGLDPDARRIQFDDDGNPVSVSTAAADRYTYTQRQQLDSLRHQQRPDNL